MRPERCSGKIFTLCQFLLFGEWHRLEIGGGHSGSCLVGYYDGIVPIVPVQSGRAPRAWYLRSFLIFPVATSQICAAGAGDDRRRPARRSQPVGARSAY